MRDLRNEWVKLADRMTEQEVDIDKGNMMSADALTLNSKVFIFYSKKGGREGLGCRIGRETDIGALGLSDWQYLAPFKSKPPMKDWIVIGAGDVDRWMELASICLTKMCKSSKIEN